MQSVVYSIMAVVAIIPETLSEKRVHIDVRGRMAPVERAVGRWNARPKNMLSLTRRPFYTWLHAWFPERRIVGFRCWVIRGRVF